jgi:xylan 1,4-beta-xylosidase
MGSPQQPSREQYGQLEKAGQLEKMGPLQDVTVENGQCRIPLGLPRQAVSLLIINWH